MSSLLTGLITALSMYSIFPMPFIEWNKSTMKYAMCFFPIIGIIIGAAVWLWGFLCQSVSLNPLLFSAIFILIPVICSGGIHIDGLIDTSDAICSHQTTERKLEILKDPHVGAFGIIICVGYFIVCLGAASQLYENIGLFASLKLFPIVCISYTLSRSISAFCIVSFKTAKNSGLAYIFSDNADKTTVRVTSIIYALLSITAMMFLNLATGIIVLCICAIWVLIFKHICYKGFGGITGDLAGYLLCVTELLVLLVCCLV